MRSAYKLVGPEPASPTLEIPGQVKTDPGIMIEASVDDILLTPYEQIEFEKLSSGLLAQLAVQEYEPFVATSALGQLAIRNVDEAQQAALAILDHDWDRYLTAYALKILFSRDPSTAIEWMTMHLPACMDAEILAAMMENVMADSTHFENKQGRELIERLRNRVREISADEFSDQRERSSFLSMVPAR
jgi:hypothetical protein